MTTVNSATAAQATAATATQQSASASSNSALTSDFETFLKMLTAQARYQDPLEPIDSTEYAAQLAQFSMVEQQVQGNDLLTGIQSQLGLANMASLSGWVGKEARSAAAAHFDGTTPVTVSPNPAAVSDRVDLVVKNAAGNEVDRVSLPVSAEPYQWTGLDEDGVVLPAGSYSFTVESWNDGKVVLSEAAEVYARVKETRMQGSDVVLILEGGSAILASSVTALRDPAS